MKQRYCPHCDGIMKHYTDTHSDINYGFQPKESWLECQICGLSIVGDDVYDEDFYWEE